MPFRDTFFREWMKHTTESNKPLLSRSRNNSRERNGDPRFQRIDFDRAAASKSRAGLGSSLRYGDAGFDAALALCQRPFSLRAAALRRSCIDARRGRSCANRPWAFETTLGQVGACLNAAIEQRGAHL
jgi:hypothetical protein